MKKTLSVLLAVLMLLCAAPFAFAAGAGQSQGHDSLKVNPYGGEEAAIDTVRLFTSGERSFLFLPADADPAAAKVYFTADGMTLDGEPMISGGSAAAFTVGTHTLVCGGESRALTVMQSAGLPAIFIETESGSLDYLLADKENKEPAVIRVYENGELTLDGELKSIKGRGNSTWAYPKRPFNIKFDKKTSLLGMPKAKKWSLLANYRDDSGIKTPAGLTLGRWLGIPYTGECRNADLYLNGEYYGNFSVCESVEVGENRVEIADLEKLNENANPGVEIEALPRGGTGEGGTAQDRYVRGGMKWVNIPNDPAEITGGYLLEMEFPQRYDDEVSGFGSERGQWVVIKSPEYASEAEVRYIAALYNEAEEALYSETGVNSLGRHYSEYFDVESFVLAYLHIELQKALDAGLASFFLYKSADSDLLYAGPVWDFDRSFYSPETRAGSDLGDPDGWYASTLRYADRMDTESILTLLFWHADFRAAVAGAWSESVFGSEPERVETLFSSLYEENAVSQQMNLVRWKKAGSADPVASATNAGDSYYAKVAGFVHDRLGVLDRAFGGDIAMLYYDANGGVGYVFNREIAFVGDSVTVVPVRVEDTRINAPAGMAFGCWNTKADGTGTTYLPGDRITLTAGTTTLYAMWEPAAAQPEEPSGEDGDARPAWLQAILDFFAKIVAFFKRLFGI